VNLAGPNANGHRLKVGPSGPSVAAGSLFRELRVSGTVLGKRFAGINVSQPTAPRGHRRGGTVLRHDLELSLSPGCQSCFS
jgi:hypothetical protein